MPYPVTVPTLLRDPDHWDGKPVLVWGVLRSGREEISIGTTRDDPHRIWVAPTELAPGLNLRRRSIVEVEAVFHKGPAGHLDGYAGELRRIVRVDRAGR